MYTVFVPLFIAALIGLAVLFPEGHRIDLPFNCLLPLEGKILGQEPEAWLGDVSGKRTGGKGGQHRPPRMDVDYIKVKGRWYKIKGPVYITRGGKILGWHQQATFQETGYVGKWASFLE